MDIRIDPSELSSHSLLPPLPNSTSSLGLEALTGCDFAMAKFPLPIQENTLDMHINAGTIFVQRKSGYDFIGNFEQADKEIARVQKCGIPPQQAFILAIGQYYPKDGLLRIKKKSVIKNYENLKYTTFLAIETKYIRSGMTVVKLNDESEIEAWIEAITREDETIKQRNNRKEIYPPKPPKLEKESYDFFQEIVEIPEDDIRSVLSRGFPGLGQGKINAICDYAEQHKYDKWGLYFLKIMTDEDDNGKAVHNIKGVGKKLRKKWRTALGLTEGYNLSVEEIDPDKAYNQGWQMGLGVFKNKLESKIPLRQAFEEAQQQIFEFYE